MKRIIFILTLVLAIATTFIIISCSKENSVQIKHDKTIESFMDDDRIVFLVENFKIIINKKPNDKNFNKEEVSKAYNDLEKIAKELRDEYGEENVIEYCKTLSYTYSKTKGCCERNSDGGINASCCNWWEHVVTSFAVGIHCNNPTGFGVMIEEIEAFYDCIQERVCNNC